MLSSQKFFDILEEFKATMNGLGAPTEFDSRALALWLCSETIEALADLREVNATNLFAAAQVLGETLLSEPGSKLTLWATTGDDSVRASLSDTEGNVLASAVTGDRAAPLIRAILALMSRLR